MPPSNVPPHVQRQLAGAIDAFVMRFGRRPTIAAFAPGRINLIGEHTDYNDGFVLPMAIQRQAVIVADRTPRQVSECWAADLNESATFDVTQPLSPMPGQAVIYLLGVADQFQKRGATLLNFDGVMTSTVPIGAGLSSSAAIEVAFATLLEQMLDMKLDALEKAKLCQKAEHTFPGTPCGIMDMYASIFARADHAVLLDCRDLRSQFVPMPPAEDATVLVIDTGVKHELALSEYADRRGTCASAARRCGIASLREATLTMIQTADLSTAERKRAMHVIAENSRTVLAAEALALGNFEGVGELMFASHDSLRDLYEVSCDELDVLVDAARTLCNQGVYGARLTGGGFGGCVVVFCHTEAVNAIRANLQTTFQSCFGREASMFTTEAAGAASPLRL